MYTQYEPVTYEVYVIETPDNKTSFVASIKDGDEAARARFPMDLGAKISALVKNRMKGLPVVISFITKDEITMTFDQVPFRIRPLIESDRDHVFIGLCGRT
jgi:hypothetical protein